MFTRSRNAGSINVTLGPTIGSQINIEPLPSLEEEINIVNRKVDIGQNPEVLAPRLESILLNTGMPEEIIPGKEIILTRECATSSKDIVKLSQKLRNADDVKFSARMENLLGNVIWINDPVLSSKRAIDSSNYRSNAARKSEIVLEHYERALASDKGYLPALKNQAGILHLVGEDEKCIESCKEYIDRKSDDSNIWELQGKAYMELASHQEALRCYDSALKLSSKNHELWFNKGLALMEIQRYQEAMTCFDRSIKLEPHNPEALNGRGDALTKMGKIDQAVESYDKANNMMPRPAFISKHTPEEIAVDVLPEIVPEIEDSIESKIEDSAEPKDELPSAEGPEADITPEEEAAIEDMEEDLGVPKIEDEHSSDMMAKEPEEVEMEAKFEEGLEISEEDLKEALEILDDEPEIQDEASDTQDHAEPEDVSEPVADEPEIHEIKDLDEELQEIN